MATEFNQLLKRLRPYVLGWVATAAGNPYAPVGGSFITVNAEGGMASEREINFPGFIVGTDQGANSTYDIDLGSYTRGDLIIGGAAAWEDLAVGTANAFLTNDATDVFWSTGFLSIAATKTLTVSNSLTLAGVDGKALTLTTNLTNQGAAGVLNWGAAATLSLAITAAKTLTLTCTDDYNLTVPATGTVALLGTANVFTAEQIIGDATGSPIMTLNKDEAGAGYLYFKREGNLDWSIYESSSETFYLKGHKEDADFYIQVNDGGVNTTVMSVDSSVPSVYFPLTVNADKFTDTGGGYDFFMPNPEKPNDEMLRHWSIETDGMRTIYGGNAVTGTNGEVIITLPSWFTSLNEVASCVFSLTSIGNQSELYLQGNINQVMGTFVVVSTKPNQSFSWIIIADRMDSIAQKTIFENPIVETRNVDSEKHVKKIWNDISSSKMSWKESIEEQE